MIFLFIFFFMASIWWLFWKWTEELFSLFFEGGGGVGGEYEKVFYGISESLRREISH